MIDMHLASDDRFRLFSNITVHDGPTIVYERLSRRGSSVSSSHAPFDAFQWEHDPIQYQQELQAYQTEWAQQCAQDTRRCQGGRERALSERLVLGDQLPMAHLSMPSPTFTPAGVGRNTSRGSWELTPPPNVLEGLDVDIDQEGQAILEDILPSMSRVTPSPTSARELAARRDLMIRGLASESINQALHPHLQRAYHITVQESRSCRQWSWTLDHPKARAARGQRQRW